MNDEALAALSDDLLDPVELVLALDVDPEDSAPDRELEVRVALRGSGHQDPPSRDAGPKRQGKLAA